MTIPHHLPGLEANSRSDETLNPLTEFDVNFSYKSNTLQNDTFSSPSMSEMSLGVQIQCPTVFKRTSLFSRLSTVALSANITRDNSKIFGGGSGRVIPPALHSPSSSRVNKSRFLDAPNVQMAGGAAGEDRVQVVCSEENGWLFCAVYDGFEGRDAADFLAGNLFELVRQQLYELELEYHPKYQKALASAGRVCTLDSKNERNTSIDYASGEFSFESFRNDVMKCLTHALAQAESEFMHRVEQNMKEYPELVAVGSCVLIMLLHGNDIYIINLGDSRGLLVTSDPRSSSLQALQLTETHTVKNEMKRIIDDHPGDTPIVCGRLKGKLKITRAIGAGYLKEKKLNDALYGMLKIENLCSPPYLYTDPFTMTHRLTDNDLFIVLGSDGLFDFFTNIEIMKLVYQFMKRKPSGDPALYLIQQLLTRVAKKTGLSVEEVMKVPDGEVRRKLYHDDVTVIVIILANNRKMLTASTIWEKPPP